MAPEISYDLTDVKEIRVADPAIYNLVCTRAVYKMSKSSNNPMFEFDWKIEGGEFNDVEIKFDNLSLVPAAAYRQDEFLDAIKWERTCTKCGTKYNKSERVAKIGSVCPSCHQKAPVRYNTGTGAELWVGIRCRARLTQEPMKDASGNVMHDTDGNERKRNRVEGYLPIE